MSEGLKKGARGVGPGVLSLQTRLSLWLGQKMRDCNPRQQDFGSFGKFTTSFSPTHLKVRNSPRLRGKSECQSFTRCVIFHVQVA